MPLIPPSSAIARTSWSVSALTTPISKPSSDVIPTTWSGDVIRRSSIARRPPTPPTRPPAIAPLPAPTTTHPARPRAPRAGPPEAPARRRRARGLWPWSRSSRLGRLPRVPRVSDGELGRELSGLGRRRADPDPALLERPLLCRCGAGRPGDDRPRMPHRLAGWRGEAGDVGDDGLGHIGLAEVRRLLLLGASDLAHPHHRLP